jgi:hypothetical protein
LAVDAQRADQVCVESSGHAPRADWLELLGGRVVELAGELEPAVAKPQRPQCRPRLRALHG